MGNIVRLSGVSITPTPGLPKIQMTEAEAAAMEVGTLSYAVSPRYIKSGGVGTSTVNGEPLEPLGNTSVIDVKDVSGKDVLFLRSDVGASVALPDGSVKGSFSAVFAISINSIDEASSDTVNFFYRMEADITDSKYLCRYYGSESQIPNKLCFLNNISTAVEKPSGTFIVIALSVDSEAGVGYFSVNGGAVQQISTTYAEEVDAKYSIGWPYSRSSLRNSYFGDLIIFDECLQKTAYGRAYFSNVISAMKRDYGIY